MISFLKTNIITLIIVFIFCIFFLLPNVVGAVWGLDDLVYALGAAIVGAFEDIIRFLAELSFLLSTLVLGLAAWIFDNFLYIGISPVFFRAEFISEAWSSIRDIANFTFILGAIYIAFLLIHDAYKGSDTWKKPLIMLIIVAFILNFSLFFARVIVDAGNLSARVFYTAISIEIADPGKHFALAQSITEEPLGNFRSIGAALYVGLKPSQIFDNKKFTDFFFSNESPLLFFLFTMLIFIIINLVLAKKLFMASFMFIGRIIWIILYMIAAPIFFIFLFFPALTTIHKDLDFKAGWLIPLLSRSFCITVYIFIIYITLLILQAEFVSDFSKEFLKVPEGQTEDIGFADMLPLFGVLILKALFVFKLLDIALKTASDMCEGGKSTIGAVINKTGSLAGKVASVVPVGRAASMLGRRAVGGVGGALAKSKMVKGIAAKGRGNWSGRFGQALLTGGEKLENKKIGGKSHIEASRERREKEVKMQRRLGRDTSIKRERNEFVLNTLNSSGDEVLDLDKIKGFRNKKLQSDLEQVKSGSMTKDDFQRDNKDLLKNTRVDQMTLEESAFKKAKKKNRSIFNLIMPDNIENIQAAQKKQKALEENDGKMDEIKKEEKTINSKILLETKEIEKASQDLNMNMLITNKMTHTDIDNLIANNSDDLKKIGIDDARKEDDFKLFLDQIMESKYEHSGDPEMLKNLNEMVISKIDGLREMQIQSINNKYSPELGVIKEKMEDMMNQKREIIRQATEQGVSEVINPDVVSR